MFEKRILISEDAVQAQRRPNLHFVCTMYRSKQWHASSFAAVSALQWYQMLPAMWYCCTTQNAGILTELGEITAAVQKKEQMCSSHVNSGTKAPLYH